MIFIATIFILKMSTVDKGKLKNDLFHYILPSYDKNIVI